jgi:hypothetical protein
MAVHFDEETMATAAEHEATARACFEAVGAVDLDTMIGRLHPEVQAWSARPATS